MDSVSVSSVAAKHVTSVTSAMLGYECFACYVFASDARLQDAKKDVCAMTTHPRTADLVAKFLQDVLADRPLGVPKLEGMARAAGLLDQSQRITHAKVFKTAKKALRIRSVRNGFGSGGEWVWVLDREVALPVIEAKRRVPLEWVTGVASLRHDHPPSDIPPHRWRQFASDCKIFLTAREKWAERAAELGWDALALFGCHRHRPLMYLGSAGLLWAINGGKLVNLYRDWAVIKPAADRSPRVYHRRHLDAASVTLPWIGLRRRFE